MPVPLKSSQPPTVRSSGRDVMPVPLKYSESPTVRFSGRDVMPVPLKYSPPPTVRFSGRDVMPVPLKSSESPTVRFSGRDVMPVHLKYSPSPMTSRPSFSSKGISFALSHFFVSFIFYPFFNLFGFRPLIFNLRHFYIFCKKKIANFVKKYRLRKKSLKTADCGKIRK